MSSTSADKRTILVTGANKGIGLEAVRQLSEQLPAARVLLGTRSVPNGQAALNKLKTASTSSKYSNITLLELDVTDSSSIAAAAQRVKSEFGQLDVLMNNSGVAFMSNGDAAKIAKDTLAVNVYGVHDVVEAFLPVLAPNATIVTVSSEVGAWSTFAMEPQLQKRLLETDALSWSDVDKLAKDYVAYASGSKASNTWPDKNPVFGAHGAYGASKALVSAYMRVLAREQQGKHKVAVVCPGYCATDLNHNTGHRSAAQGGTSVIFPILHDFESGKFYQDGNEHSYVSKSEM